MPISNEIFESYRIKERAKEHVTEFKGKKYINLTVSKKRETDQYGKTHTVTVNTWKPEGQTVDNSPSDLPF
jgi:predicted RNA-binding protein (virulence factor B family)